MRAARWLRRHVPTEELHAAIGSRGERHTPRTRAITTLARPRGGVPQENVNGYKVGSAINFAEGLQGKLLIVHGSGDDNVHFQGTEKLMNRLIELGKPFDMMMYPNRTHSISEGPGTTPHVYKLIARYFYTNLPAGPR